MQGLVGPLEPFTTMIPLLQRLSTSRHDDHLLSFDW